jgi:hypothetical protein
MNNLRIINLSVLALALFLIAEAKAKDGTLLDKIVDGAIYQSRSNDVLCADEITIR